MNHVHKNQILEYAGPGAGASTWAAAALGGVALNQGNGGEVVPLGAGAGGAGRRGPAAALGGGAASSGAAALGGGAASAAALGGVELGRWPSLVRRTARVDAALGAHEEAERSIDIEEYFSSFHLTVGPGVKQSTKFENKYKWD
uniref:Uncharacterized protein n=1 Tax=Oryza glumipatula TaxID=40148 RepID=A0A0E0A9T6_9ORYZ